MKRPTPHERFWSKVDKRGVDECWLWLAAPRRKDQGYGAFWFEGRHQPASRMALVFSGVKVPPDMKACHSCDNPPCCNPAHLFVGTNQENVDDKVSKGRQVRGARYWNTKLTRADVEFIRSHKVGSRPLAAGLPEKLAAQFGISRQYVSEVLSTGWKNP